MGHIITLISTGRYKDGGSEGYKTAEGQIYWLCFKFGDRNKQYRGKLFEGNINDFPKQITFMGRG